jgi:hypothetical protein
MSQWLSRCMLCLSVPLLGLSVCGEVGGGDLMWGLGLVPGCGVGLFVGVVAVFLFWWWAG